MASARILVVDDDALTARLMADVCTGAGYAVEIASDGVEALERVRERAPDAVLADVMMPRLDGFGLCAALKADPALREIPVLMITAHDDVARRLEALDRGADDFVTKPFKAQDLLARLERAIAFRQARARLDQARRTAEAALRAQAEGVGDFAALGRDLASEIARAERYGRDFAAVCVVPTAFSPGRPDRVSALVRTAGRLRGALRDADRVYLLGDEEIVVLMPECGEEALAAATDRVGTALAEKRDGFAVGGAVHQKGEGKALLRRARLEALASEGR